MGGETGGDLIQIRFDGLIFDANLSDYGYSGYYAYAGTLTVDNGAFLSGDYGIYNGGSAITLNSSVVSGNTYGIFDDGSAGASWRISSTSVPFSQSYQVTVVPWCSRR